MCSPTRGLDSKVSISAGLSSQRSESETKPHTASQTASHLQRRTSYSRNRSGLFFNQGVTRPKATPTSVTVNQDRNLGISHVEAWRHGSRIYWIIVAL